MESETKIEVVLHAYLSQARFERGTVVLHGQATVDALLDQLAIAQHEIGAVYVNGRDGTFGQQLAEGDRVSLLPFIDGG